MADIVGTPGVDTIAGTSDADTITALGGNDTVNAGDGNDTINGGAGNDTLNGEGGDDTFVEDELTSALDIFNGGDGTDTIELRAALVPVVTSFGSTTFHSLSSATSMSSIERLVFASQPGQLVQATFSYANWAASGLTQIIGGAGRDFITIGIGPAAGTYDMPSLPITGWDPISTNAWEHGGDFVVLSSVAPATSSVTLNALAGASFFQIIAGGRGNDILNGSANADTIDARAGGDTVNAGAGNDAIAIVNNATPSGGGFGAPSTNSGLGGVWDGGDGTDVISIGGTVNLQATLLNIEGVHLQAAFIPPVPNTTIQYAAELTLDSAHIAMLPANAFFAGEGTVRFDIDDGQSFSIPSGYTITSGSDISYIIDAGIGDGLTFTGSNGDDEINLGRGSQTANGGDGNDVLNNGVSILPGDGLISMLGGNGDDILILDNPTEGNVFLDGGADNDLLQLHSYSVGAPGNAPIVHSVTSDGSGSGVTGIEAVQFVSVAGLPMALIADIDAGFGTIIGGAGIDQMIFGVTAAGTYSMPNFTLLNWNTNGGDIVGFGVTADATFAVTLNGRNDIGQFFFGGLAADTFNGGAMSDRMFGVAGADIFNGNDGDDFLHVTASSAGATYNGGSGNDTLVVDGSAGSFAGVTGIESVQLNAANLTLTGSQFANGLAFTTALSGTGSITVNMDAGINFLSQGFAFTGSSVTMTVNGTSGTDIIKCGTGVHTINAGDGVDQIRGGTAADIINGGDGNDKIIGFTGADIITGGAGSDQFRYFFQGDSGIGAANSDRLTDFTIGSDKLNFLLIDADAVAADDQAFNFIGNAAFTNSGVGQIRYTNSGADLLVQADVNGDGVADMEIILQGLNGGTLTAGDFIL
jgi:Ca2+-binding RTX toxin-like protein